MTCAQSLDDGMAEWLDLGAPPGFYASSRFRLSDDPRGDSGYLAQEVRFLARLEPKPLSEFLKFLIEDSVGLGLEAGHGAPSFK